MFTTFRDRTILPPLSLRHGITPHTSFLTVRISAQIVVSQSFALEPLIVRCPGMLVRPLTTPFLAYFATLSLAHNASVICA